MTQSQPSCNYLSQARSSGKNLHSEIITSNQKATIAPKKKKIQMSAEHTKKMMAEWLLNLHDIRKWGK